MPIQTCPVAQVGAATIPSPLGKRGFTSFVSDKQHVLYEAEFTDADHLLGKQAFIKAGPREKIYFDPEKTTAALVTCGGLSPGLNNVIRSAYLELRENYGVKRILGIRNGYLGLNSESGLKPLELCPEFLDHTQDEGGTILGSTRGPQEPAVMANFLVEHGIDILFAIGGDGTQRGANRLSEEVQKRGLKKAIVGIPKTIDNDIPYVQTSFGYITALEQAAAVIKSAYVEANGTPGGIGLVKLMGRDAGFIAAGAAVAAQVADFVLIPEVPFPLEGEQGLLASLERCLARRDRAVIVVSEGAGQHLFQSTTETKDASGNKRYNDIGVFLRDRIKSHFAERKMEISLKYMEPSYVIRSVPANAWDRVLSDQMARHAVHAAMAGKTGVVVGNWGNKTIYVPMSVIAQEKRRVPIQGDFWNAVIAATGQPRWG